MDQDFTSAMRIVAQWIEQYKKEIEDYPVQSPLRPGEVLKQLPSSPSRSGESFADIFADFKRIIIPGITHWQHPRFFAYFPANSSPPSVLAEMLIAAMGVQGMSWATSPAATELEIRMMEWLREMFGLSDQFTGVIQDSASSSTMIAMLVARERATDYRINEEGYTGYPLVAYCSEEAHSSVEKAVKILGLGRKNLRKIKVNSNQEMRVDLLEAAIQEDLKNGLKPFFVVGAFGTTSTTAVDPLGEIQAVAAKYGLWFHVDAAYAGAALVLPECRDLADGINGADSLVVNPHKWLLTTFDCSAFFIRHKDELIRTLSILPEYLKTSEGDEVVNFRDWGLGLGRRFRSLKLWFVLRWYGVDGISEILRRHLALAKIFEEQVRKDSSFEVVAQRNFNLICFRFKGSDEDNMLLLQRLNQSGTLFLSHTKINGRVALRFVVGQTDVEARHVDEAWGHIQKVTRAFDQGGRGFAENH